VTNSIYFNFLGYIFKISIKAGREFAMARDKFRAEVSNAFIQALVKDGKPKKVDFYLDVYAPTIIEIISEKNDRRVYQNIFTINSDNRVSCTLQISIYQFRTILWINFLKILSRNNGFLLHSSAVSVDGNAFIFLGDSGAGKSTTANLLKKFYPTLADDNCVIKKENNKFHLYSTPFPEKISWVRRDATSYDIGKVFFLKKADYFKTEKITNKDIVLKKFVKQGMTGEDVALIMPFILDFISNFDDFYYLYFEKDGDKLKDLLQKLK